MADITKLFKATVKTVKVREKSLTGTHHGPDKSILPLHKPTSEFSASAKEVVSTISKLRDFLLEHRKDYINAPGYLGLEPCRMTDAERDKIDTESEAFIKTCHEAIVQLKIQVGAHKVLRQVKEHKDGIVELADKYLKAVCQLYSEQKAVRVKRVVDRKCLSRLESLALQKSKGFSESRPPQQNHHKAAEPEQDNTRRQSDGKVQGTSGMPPVLGFMEEGEEDGGLSVEEEQMLQLENEQLFNEMSSLKDEVKRFEGSIVEIARLQEFFTDQVLEQEKKIDKIADVVVGTTENIKEANEEIREAMKNNAGFRVWILFFLIVCTFSLLFLDWYNA